MRPRVAQFANAIVIDVGCGVGDNLRYITRYARLFGTSMLKKRYALPRRCWVAWPIFSQLPLRRSLSRSTRSRALHEVLEHGKMTNSRCRNRPRSAFGRSILSLPTVIGSHHITGQGTFSALHEARRRRIVASSWIGGDGILAELSSMGAICNYCYVMSRLHVCLADCRSQTVAAEVCLPFSERRLIDVFAWIEPTRRREMDSDYSMLETSTFVVALKT